MNNNENELMVTKIISSCLLDLYSKVHWQVLDKVVTQTADYIGRNRSRDPLKMRFGTFELRLIISKAMIGVNNGR